MQVNGCSTAVLAVVCIGALGAVYGAVVAVAAWHVSMVMTALPTGILAAPQQFPVPHNPSSV